jgi:hypothetical protein
VNTQFIVMTSTTGAVHKRKTLFLILTVTTRTDVCSHCTQQVHRRTNAENDEVHGPPDDKQPSV